MKRTTDNHVEQATNQFFENLGIEQAVLEYFSGEPVKQKLSEGYSRYKQLLEKAVETVSEDAEDLAKAVTEKLTITEEAYEQNTYEVFKEKIADIFHPAAMYIDIKTQMITLFQKQESEDLLLLVMSAMDEFLDYITNRFSNIIVLLMEGIPMEVAEEIADEAGDDEIVPVRVEVHCADDTDEGDNDNEDCGDEPQEECHCCCNGGCGGDCKCGEGKHESHCQCEDGCKCDNHTDE